MHMSQLASGCNTWVNSLVLLQQQLNPPTHAQDHGIPASQLTTNLMDFPTAEPSHSDLDAMPINVVDGPDSLTEEHFIGAAQTFAKGMSFVDQFNADQFSTYQ